MTKNNCKKNLTFGNGLLFAKTYLSFCIFVLTENTKELYAHLRVERRNSRVKSKNRNIVKERFLKYDRLHYIDVILYTYTLSV